jgi:hypothetical protein
MKKIAKFKFDKHRIGPLLKRASRASAFCTPFSTTSRRSPLAVISSVFQRPAHPVRTTPANGRPGGPQMFMRWCYGGPSLKPACKETTA